MNAPPVIIDGRNSYTRILAEAWEAHLQPRAVHAPTVVSLFAGCGGSTLGYSMAGYRECLAVEWNTHAVETFRLNFPAIPVYHGDITALDATTALRMASLTPGMLDVLDGSPPCQGFSAAGQRNLADARNQLFHEYVRLLHVFRPKAFIMENVAGLIQGKMKLIFADIMRALKACGYRVATRLVNAKYFCVPQERSRLIFLGIREDMSQTPTHPDAQRQPFTVRQALQDVPQDPSAFTVGAHTQIWHAMRMVPPGRAQPGHHSHRRLAWDTPAPTLLVGGGAGHYHYWHPNEHRVLTFLELQRLASFGDAFSTHGKPGERWARIGNAVPPLFMRALATHMRTLLAL